MAHAWLEPDVTSLCLLGVGGPALALAGLLVRRRPRECDLAAAGLAAAAAAAAAANGPDWSWLPPLALACACVLSRLLRSGRARPAPSAALALARRPAAQWGALVAAGPLLALGWASAWTGSQETC